MVEAAKSQKIRTQIEYYLGDANLARDKFFREQILTDKQGLVAVQHFLNCNNIKKEGWSAEDILAACKSSDHVEVIGKAIRRKDNKALPEKSERKRDQKAGDKKDGSAPEQPQEDEYDEDGKVILVEKDFDNPVIVSYAAEVKDGEDFKVDWKAVEKQVKESFPKLKLIYSRMDEHGGHLAFSQLRLKKDLLAELCAGKLTIQERPFSFKMCEGEDLKDFWKN